MRIDLIRVREVRYWHGKKYVFSFYDYEATLVRNLAEEIRREIDQSILRLIRGEFEEVTDFDD